MSSNDPSPSLLPAPEPAPTWRVVSFIDPAGAGRDLAFTSGLTVYELPELLLWARPTEGFDPGTDWLLSHRERSRLLGAWATDLLAGRLWSGEEREEIFDGGESVVRFRFGRPRSALPTAYPHLSEQTWIISVSWSLQRSASFGWASRQTPLTPRPAVERRMQGWITKADQKTVSWAAKLAATGALDPAADLAELSIGRPSGHRFGPMTPWVDARISQLLAADPQVLAAFLHRLNLTRWVLHEDHVLELLTALAQPSGRCGALREAARAAQELALAIAGWPDHPRPSWAQAVLIAGPACCPGIPPALAAQTLGVLLVDGLEELLMTAVLTDLATPALIAAGAGPWEWAAGDGQVPGRQWLAPPAVRQATLDLLAQATPGQLAAAASRARLPFGLTERHQLSQVISALQTTAAASAKPGSLFRRDQRKGLAPSIVHATDVLAGQLLTAIALPRRLPPGSWELVRDTLYPVAPDLPAEPVLPADADGIPSPTRGDPRPLWRL